MLNNIDTRVSVMDIFTISGSSIMGLWLIFGFGADLKTDVKLIKTEQVYMGVQIAQVDTASKDRHDQVTHEIEKVEENAKEKEGQILQKLAEQRAETNDSFNKIDGKLDKLIERELRRNGGH